MIRAHFIIDVWQEEERVITGYKTGYYDFRDASSLANSVAHFNALCAKSQQASQTRDWPDDIVQIDLPRAPGGYGSTTSAIIREVYIITSVH